MKTTYNLTATEMVVNIHPLCMCVNVYLKITWTKDTKWQTE